MPTELFPTAAVASIDALFDENGVGPNRSTDVRETVLAADIVTAVDHTTRREVLVFGRRAIERMFTTNVPEAMSVLRIGIDRGSDDLPRLLAVIDALKGRNDYRCTDRIRPPHHEM